MLSTATDRQVTLLAAGTDGRDGPTDAAGAIVNETTWTRIRSAGRDPQQDLESHDSYAALDAAGELVRTGLTRTNVRDVFFAIARA
jgi:hydroxypyruvate reductase